MAVVFTLVVGRKILRLESRVFGGRGVMESGEARANGGKREEGKGKQGWKGRERKANDGDGNEGTKLPCFCSEQCVSTVVSTV